MLQSCQVGRKHLSEAAASAGDGGGEHRQGHVLPRSGRRRPRVRRRPGVRLREGTRLLDEAGKRKEANS